MRRVTALVLFCMILTGGRAAAQTHAASDLWFSPGGQFTLRPAAADARLLGPGPDVVAAFQLGAHPSPVRMCVVRENSVPSPQPIAQAVLNQRFQTLVATPPANPSANITGRRAFDRGGVTVLATRMETPNIVMHEWMFALQTATGASVEKIDCSGAPPVSAAEEAQFDAFLDTLQFKTQS